MRYFIWILAAQTLVMGSSSMPFGSVLKGYARTPMHQTIEAVNDKTDVPSRGISLSFTAHSQFQRRETRKQAADPTNCHGKLQKRGQCLGLPQGQNNRRQNGSERSSRGVGDRNRNNLLSSSHTHERFALPQSPISETKREPTLEVPLRTGFTVSTSKWPLLQRSQSLGSLAKPEDTPRPTLRRAKSITLMVDTPSIKAEAAGKIADAAEQKARSIRDAMNAHRVKAYQSLAAAKKPYREGLHSRRLTIEKIRRHDNANTHAHTYVRHLNKLSQAFSEAADASQEANRATRVYRNKKKQRSAILEGEAWRSSAKWNSYRAQLHRIELRNHQQGGLRNYNHASKIDYIILAGKAQEAKTLAKYDKLQHQRHNEDDGYDSDIGRLPVAMRSSAPPLTIGNPLVRPLTPSPSGSRELS